MPPAGSCPRCGRLSPANTTFCSGCGATLSSTSSGKGWKLLLGAVTLFAGLLWASLIYTQTRPAAPPDGASPARALKVPAAPPGATPQPSPSSAHKSTQRLARKRAQAGAAAESADAAVDDEKADDEESSSAAPSHQYPPAQTPAAGGGTSDDYYTNTHSRRVHRPVFSESGPPAGATAQCADGTYSFSQSRRGTCSHHGGVSRWL